jgi:dTDP-4-amino-4,6-dideoxygalactose transaminase
MCALLLDIQGGDEVIIPSYTFVSTANSFVLRGAKIVFADSYGNHPNIAADLIESLITPKTKAIVVVHYAGVSCDMDSILTIAQRHNIFVIEDAAQAIDSYYKGRPVGGIGHLATFSFHETKNIISGEGGMLVINDQQFATRADLIWEKGTNRKAFFNGEVDKYGWVDIGSSFLPSEIIAAFLFAQLEQLEIIQAKRKVIWKIYFQKFNQLQTSGKIKLPNLPSYSSNNAHMFYLLCDNKKTRDALIAHLQGKKIGGIFHYLSLHKSPFYFAKHDGRELPMSDLYSDCLLRLPFYNELTLDDQNCVIEEVYSFFLSNPG